MVEYKDYDKRILETLEKHDLGELRAILAELKEKNLDINKCVSEYNYVEYAYQVRAPLECYEILLTAGASSIEKIQSRDAPITHAVIRAEVDIVAALVKNGAEINIWGSPTPEENYIEGFYDVDLETKQFTLNTDAPDPDDHKEERFLSKPLICLAIENYYRPEGREIINLLLARKDLNLLASDELKDNAYSYAAHYGDTNLLKELARREPRIINYEKNDNLLNIAVEGGNYENLKYLLEEIKIPANTISKVWPQDCLEKLLDMHNTEVLAYTYGYRTPEEASAVVKKSLSLAGQVKMFQLLLKNGAKFTKASQRYYDAALKMEHGVIPKIKSDNERQQ